MKSRDSEQPLETPRVEATYFFFQCLQEKLSDTSNDSYKAPALNTFSRTLELERIAHRNHRANLNKETLTPFLQELAWSIGNDEVLDSSQRALCKVHIQEIGKDIDDPKRIALGLAGLRLTLGDYFARIKEAIEHCISEQPKSKMRIAELAASFIVQAELHGFPRRHTFHVAQIVLRGRLRRPYSDEDSVEIVSEFLSRFDPHKSTRYDSYFLASKGCSRFPELLELHHLKIVDDIDQIGPLNTRQREVVAQRDDDNIFLWVEDRKERCAVAAHEFCLRQFRSFASKIAFTEHKNALSASRLALIKNRDTGRVIIVRDNQDPMHGVVDDPSITEREGVALASALSDNHFSPASASRLERAIRYHFDALRSDSVENKLVDMWAALEGILSAPKKGTSRIDYFAESLLPAITLSYPHKILHSLYLDFHERDDLISMVRTSVPGEKGDYAKFVRFMLCEEYGTHRDHCASTLTRNPILLNRCWAVTNRFSTRAKILESTKAHRERVKWNLERIYAMRNTIMHDASALPHIRTLVENLHAYLDLLIRSLIRTGMSALESSITIESALHYLSAWEKHRFASLQDASMHPKRSLREDDIWDSVFGSDLTLTPKDV